MDNKKKLIGYLKLLLSLLFGVLYVNLSTTSEASTHFNYTSGELSNIYYNLRASSLGNSEVEDTTYHDKVVTRWASGDIIMESLTDNDWFNIITDLNDFMESYYRSSGEFIDNLGDDYGDVASDTLPYWIFAQPAQSYSTTTESINFIFVPYILTAYQITETTSNVNGIRFYKPQSQLLGRSGDNTPTTSVYNAVMLRINPNKTYTIKTNQQGIEYNSSVASTLSGNADFFRRRHPIFYNPYTGISYPINVILAYRNNVKTGLYWLNGSSYGDLVETRTNYQYNLLTGIITSGDSSGGSSAGGSGEGSTDIDLSETNGLLTDIVGALTGDINSGDFMSSDEFSGELLNSLNLPIIDDASDSFFMTLWEALRISLLSESGEVYHVPFLESSFTMDAKEFKISNEPLNSFFRIGFIVGYIFTEYKLIHLLFRVASVGGFADIVRWLYHKDYSDFL